ncbi:MAG: hypothetical protein ACHQ4G_12250, partial [Opitutales bacterium]
MSLEPPISDTAPSGIRPGLARLGTLLALFLALVLPLLLSSRTTNYVADEQAYYLPAVRAIAAHWPRLDLLADSRSATAPGYPYFLATLSQVTGTGLVTLRTINLLVALALLVTLWQLFPPRQSPLALAALLPLACSNFVVKSAAYVTTDNPALLTTTACLALLLFNRRPALALAGASVTGALAVFARQISIWVVAPLAWQSIGSRRIWWRSLLC